MDFESLWEIIWPKNMPKRYQQCIREIILRTLAFKNGASSLRMSPIWLLVPLIKKE